MAFAHNWKAAPLDDFQASALSNWVTISAASLLLVNLIAALFTQNRSLVIGAIALLCFWIMSIAVVLLLRDKDAAIWRLVIDSGAVLLFYKLAERDKVTLERHDWAALICFCYVWLAIFDLKFLLFGGENSLFLRAISNVIFYFKILVNFVPSAATILGFKRVLIAGPR
nr:hypothetical protein [Nitrosomonas nitrosa]